MTAAVTDARVTKIEGQVEGLRGQVLEHDAFINGNGKPGAKLQLQSLEDGLRTLQANVGDIKATLDTLIKTIVGLIVTVIGATVVFYLLSVVPHVAK